MAEAWQEGSGNDVLNNAVALTLSITQSNLAHVDISPKKTGRVLNRVG